MDVLYKQKICQSAEGFLKSQELPAEYTVLLKRKNTFITSLIANETLEVSFCLVKIAIDSVNAFIAGNLQNVVDR